MRVSPRRLILLLGAAIVLDAIAVLEFVAVSPDLRIRAFLLDSASGHQDGIVARETPGLEWKRGQEPLTAGDKLRYVNRRPTPTLLDFFDANASLYHPDLAAIDYVGPADDPAAFSSPEKVVGGIVDEIDGHGRRRRLVEVLYQSQASGRLEPCWVEVQSVPAGELGLTFAWLLPHLCILLVAGAAVWQRPSDRPSRLFFVMTAVTLGAYVGGFHWWTVANSSLLTFPFIACAVLLPAVTLHFFLVFPRPVVGWVARRPRTMAVLLYALPAVAMAAGAAFLIYTRLDGSAAATATEPAAVRQKLAVLSALRTAVDLSIGVAAVYYAATLAALIRSLLTVREPAERAQVRWILAAAIAATLPVGYTIFLAATDRTAFAFGGARLPMFFASFGFLLAYAVGMARHRLLLVDEVIGKGVRYYLARVGVTSAVALVLAALGLWAGAWGDWLPQPQSTLAVVAVIVLAVTLLLVARDRLQQEIDRRFFSEKYQLGAALRGVHAAAERLADEGDLGRRVLDSCREVLDISRAAVYRRSGDVHRLVAAVGEGFPAELVLDPSVVRAVAEGGSIQRVLTGSKAELPPGQSLLRRLNAQVLYAPPSHLDAATLLLLGPKANDAAYTAEDLTFLSALGHVTDVALDGAGAQRLHAEQLRTAQEALSAQARQIAVLQAELTEHQRRQGIETPPSEGEFRREIIRGDSPALRQVLDTVRKVASSDATVMIRGESGTGKELLAQVLHDNSPRRDGPMIRVHCAALSPTLLESELFGHVKGAFTGADRDKVGRFQMADGGTLFLDEIGEISPEVQVKLLRVLQERSFEPVGSGQTVEVDVRLVTATNRNLEEMIATGDFREDLYYRLNVVGVTLPPLRERKEDVYDLAFTFLHRASQRLGKSVTRIEDSAAALLMRYDWPGNVRELQNVIERAVVLSSDDAIMPADLPDELWGPPAGRERPVVKALPAPSTGGRRRPTRTATLRPKPTSVARRVAVSSAEADEREQLVAALKEAEGNKAEAARLMGLPRSTFFSKLKKYGLD